MPALSRADTSVLGRWWWSIDRWVLFAVVGLIGFGYVMTLAASPSVAERIGEPRNAFIVKQVLFLALGGALVVAVSLLSERELRRLAVIGCAAALALTAATLLIGVEIKGARRWIAFPGFSLQPSEFLKPCFAVVTAWLLAEGKRQPRFPGMLIAAAILGLIVLVLKSQPDIGMLSVVVAVFLTQLFIAGLNLLLVAVGFACMTGAGVGAYFLFPHVHNRVTHFLHPATGDHYQITTALEAFGNGGLLGRGPGEGEVKNVLPDAHADFVFAVTGEEFGFLVCLAVVCVFAFIVLHSLLRVGNEQNFFIILTISGLAASFGLQAFVNMASSLHLIPTKGMTLPFISYGGSSVLAVALEMGMLLGFTRQRHHGAAP